MAQQAPTTGPGRQQPAGAAAGGAGVGIGGHDDLRLAELGQRRCGGGAGVQALSEVTLVGLVKPVGQFGNDGRRQLGGQFRQVAADQAGLGHGLPSRAALTMAAKSRQSARLPDSARFPAAVSRYSRRWRPATTDHDPVISPACSSLPRAG